MKKQLRVWHKGIVFDQESWPCSKDKMITSVLSPAQWPSGAGTFNYAELAASCKLALWAGVDQCSTFLTDNDNDLINLSHTMDTNEVVK